MTATSYAAENIPEHLVHGFFGTQDVTTFIFNFDWKNLDGGVISTLGDLETFFYALFDGAMLQKMETLEQMLDISQNNYGLGIELFSNGDLIYGHSGSTPGFNSAVAYIQSQRKLILMMNNQTETKIADNTFLKS